MKSIKNKLALVLTLSLALVSNSSFASPAAIQPISAPVEATDSLAAELPSSLVDYLQGMATVKAILENGQLLVTIDGMDVALNISEETLTIDTKTGQVADLSTLKVGNKIYVYYSGAMTRSLPPQSHAIAIVTQVEEYQSHAQLFTVKEIILREDGSVRALNKEGDLIVAFSKENPLTPYKTKQIVGLDDIQVGSQLFIWYEIVAMSYPGQTGATKAVYIGQEEGMGPRAVYTPWGGLEAYGIQIDNKVIAYPTQKPLDKNGHVLVPLRQTAQTLGFSVKWDNASKMIHLDNGSVKTSLTLNDNAYYKASSQAIGLTQNFTLSSAPTLVNGTSYVPAALFNLLYSDNSAVVLELLDNNQ